MQTPSVTALKLEATCSELTASHARLKAKTADLEARSRRNNICIIGLPESVEGQQPTAFFSDLLTRLLGEDVLPTPHYLIEPTGHLLQSRCRVKGRGPSSFDSTTSRPRKRSSARPGGRGQTYGSRINPLRSTRISPLTFWSSLPHTKR